MFGRVFIPVSNGKNDRKIVKIHEKITIVKVKHFYNLSCNQENFHDVPCLTVMKSSSH